MDNHAGKFIFLGAVIIGVFVLHLFSGLPANSAAEQSAPNAGGAIIETPRFVFPPTAVSADTSAASGAPSSMSVPANTNATTMPTVHAVAWLIADARDGKLIASSEMNRRWPTASLAKLMSATILLDKIPLDAQITVTPEVFATDPNEFNLAIHGKYVALDLLRAMLLPSSNVAAEAIANYYGRDAFITEMNVRAAAWGMTNTHYDDPSGISAGDESTPADLAALATEIYAHYPQILSISRSQQFVIMDHATGKTSTLKSINTFAGQADFVGGKTGHTEEADGNLLSLFTYANHPVVIIVLGSGARFEDTAALYNWYKTALATL